MLPSTTPANTEAMDRTLDFFEKKKIGDNLSLILDYGSGFFPEEDNAHKIATQTRKQLDNIVVVKNTDLFHTKNFVDAPQEYPTRLHKTLGLPYIKFLQNIDPKIYYILAGEIKYGLIQEDHFFSDLEHCPALYVEGRLHKLFHVLVSNVPDEILYPALSKNLERALHIGLLYMEGMCTMKELLITIAEISYKGSLRRKFNLDNGNKIGNKVSYQGDALIAMYKEHIHKLVQTNMLTLFGPDPLSQKEIDSDDLCLDTKLYKSAPASELYEQWLFGMPSSIQDKLGLSKNRLSPTKSIPDALDRALREIVGPASLRVGIKSLATVGFGQSKDYVLAKQKKKKLRG